MGTGKESSLSSSASSAASAELMSQNNWLVWKIKNDEQEMRKSGENWNPYWPVLLPSFCLCHYEWPIVGGAVIFPLNLMDTWPGIETIRTNPKILKQKKR